MRPLWICVFSCSKVNVPIDINLWEHQALNIQQRPLTYAQRLDKRNVKSIELSVGSVTMPEIKAVLKAERETTESKGISDLTTEQLKKVIGDFRQRWRDAHAKYPGSNSEYNGTYSNGELHLMEEMGAIFLDRKGKHLSIFPKEYANFEWKKQAIRELDRRRLYARRQEHLDQLGGDECMKKPGTAERCELCYPIKFSEMVDMKKLSQTFDMKKLTKGKKL